MTTPTDDDLRMTIASLQAQLNLLRAPVEIICPDCEHSMQKWHVDQTGCIFPRLPGDPPEVEACFCTAVFQV